MPTIAVCVIAKNEEQNVKRMTDSIKGLFDQYVFVDTGSTDKTVEIAKAEGWEIHNFEWVNDFSKARNFAFSQAKTDFIFWMDLDDVLDGRDGFENWKEVVMPLYDYHMANYNYALDPTGKPVCTFVRERVIRRSKGMQWEYPIHEGITPNSANSPISMNFTTSWRINHLRTAEDLAKDKSRNLGIFKGMIAAGEMKPRMYYYYGKELFENGNPIEAIPQLEKALVSRDLELHDRIIATQYIAFAHMQAAEMFKDSEVNEKNKNYGAVINHSMNGLMISPRRAEFHNMIGDAFLKQGKLEDAIPFYSAATACGADESHKTPSAIFRSEDAYGNYPFCQMARVFANVQKYELARKYAREAFDVSGSNESRSILADLDRITTQAESYKLAKQCEDIVLTTPPLHAYPFDPAEAEKKAMGGSETAMIEMAKNIAQKSGRVVKVFMMREDAKEFDGVEYLPNGQLMTYLSQHKPRLHIAWRHNIKITDAKTFVWSHDLFTPGAEYTDFYEKILCLTPWHAKHMHATQGIPMNKIHVTRNGVIPEKFQPVDAEAKDPMQFVFGSSPDRGLDNAILVLDKVREKHPVKLSIFYGWDHWGDCQGRPDLFLTKSRLEKMVKERPWITYKGATQQDELMREYRKAAYNVQPSAWLETSMISAMELVFCGVYPIMRKIAGVQDTLKPFVEKGMAELVEQSGEFGPDDIERYADRVCKAIDEKKYLRVKVSPDGFTWGDVAEEWLKDLPALAGYTK